MAARDAFSGSRSDQLDQLEVSIGRVEDLLSQIVKLFQVEKATFEDRLGTTWMPSRNSS